MSKFPRALADAQVEHSEKRQKCALLTDQLRLKDKELKELRRQLELLKQPANEQQDGASGLDANPASGSNGPNLPARLSHVLNQPQEVLADVFAPLSRFDIDSAQYTCRRFRWIVETLLTTVCLRDLRRVELRRMGKQKVSELFPPGLGDRFKLECREGSEEDMNWSCVVRCQFVREIAVQLRGAGQDEVKRSSTFRLAKEAGQYLLGLIHSSTLESLILDAVAPQEAFFKGLASIAPTVRVRDLALQNCTVSHIDASLLHNALLQFSTVERMTLGNRLKAHQITDQFLAAAPEKHTTRFTVDSKPVDADIYEVTDVGIQAFLFQTTRKTVEIYIWHVAISPTFCADLFKNALTNPDENELLLTIQHVNTREQDFTGILEYDDPSGDIHRFHAQSPSGMELTLWVDQDERASGGHHIQPPLSFHRFKANKRQDYTIRGPGAWTSDDDSDQEEDAAADPSPQPGPSHAR